MKDISDTELLKQALSRPAVQKQVRLADTQLNLLEWGRKGSPGLLFIHGGAAHAGWWRFIAPFFFPEYHCVAVDLSGHGDSARRSNYTPGLWCEEVLALTRDRDIFDKTPVIIGHSMGGLIGVRAAAVLADELPGLIIIDSSVRAPVPNHEGDGDARKKRNGSNLLGRKRTYESRQQAIDRFRLIPPQPCKNQALLTYIAAESVCRSGDVWTWKYDPDAFRGLQPVSVFHELKKIKSPTAIILGSQSRILDRSTAEKMKSEIRNAMEVIVINDSFHHLMLDQPVILIEEVKRVLTCWKYANEWP